MLCHSGENFEGNWSAPAMFSVSGVSVGLQVGGTASDFVLLLMNPKVVKHVLDGETKLGADATAAAGPGAAATSALMLTSSSTDGPRECCSLAYPWEVQRCNQTMTRTTACTARRLPQPISRAEPMSQPSEEGKSIVTVLDSKVAKHSN